MKKWMYVIFPGIGLVVFLFLYVASQKELAERDRLRAEQVAHQKAVDEAHKEDIEKKARDDAAKHAAERAAEESKIAADKEAKWQADSRRIQSDTDQSNVDLQKYSKMVSDLQIELDTLHKQKEATSRASFNAAKAVEMGEVERRSAEMEIQRTVAMIADRADQSSLTKQPPAPPAEASGS